MTVLHVARQPRLVPSEPLDPVVPLRCSCGARLVRAVSRRCCWCAIEATQRVGPAPVEVA